MREDVFLSESLDRMMLNRQAELKKRQTNDEVDSQDKRRGGCKAKIASHRVVSPLAMRQADVTGRPIGATVEVQKRHSQKEGQVDDSAVKAFRYVIRVGAEPECKELDGL